MAQLEALKRMVPDTLGGAVNFETDSNLQENLRPFIFTFDAVQDGGGGISYSNMLAALRTASADNAATIFKVISVAIESNNIKKPVKFVRYNDLAANYQNYFKKPSTDKYQYTFYGFGLQFFPTQAGEQYEITVIKYPKTMSLVVDPEWSDYMMNQIIAIALQYAGVSVRDGELTGQILNSNISK